MNRLPAQDSTGLLSKQTVKTVCTAYMNKGDAVGVVQERETMLDGQILANKYNYLIDLCLGYPATVVAGADVGYHVPQRHNASRMRACSIMCVPCCDTR